jgi:inorganic pyrophosphatase
LAVAKSTSVESAERFPKVVEVVVEIPSGSRNKYEFDEKTGVIRLDRVLSSAVYYNFEYGYIEGTRADDGDHTDALVLLAEPTFPGCRINARPVGGLRMRDDKGDDFKVLCVALGDPQHAHIKHLDQVPAQRLKEIEHFFATYKLLEDKRVDVSGWADLDDALQLLRDDHGRWLAEAQAGH